MKIGDRMLISLMVLSTFFGAICTHPFESKKHTVLTGKCWGMKLFVDDSGRLQFFDRRKRNTADENSLSFDRIQKVYVDYVTSLTSLALLRVAKNEFFILERSNTSVNKLIDIFHPDLLSLGILGSDMYLSSQLSDTSLIITNSTYTDLDSTKKTFFDMLVVFRSMFVNQTTLGDITKNAFQQLGVMNSDASDTSPTAADTLRGTFIIQNITVSTRNCTCGWVELEKIMADNSTERAVNLFMYHMCDVTGARVCKEDALHIVTTQESPPGLPNAVFMTYKEGNQQQTTDSINEDAILQRIDIFGELPPMTTTMALTTTVEPPWFAEGTLSYYMLFGVCSLAGFVLIIGGLIVMYKLCRIRMGGENSRNMSELRKRLSILVGVHRVPEQSAEVPTSHASDILEPETNKIANIQTRSDEDFGGEARQMGLCVEKVYRTPRPMSSVMSKEIRESETSTTESSTSSSYSVTGETNSDDDSGDGSSDEDS